MFSNKLSQLLQAKVCIDVLISQFIDLFDLLSDAFIIVINIEVIDSKASFTIRVSSSADQSFIS